MSTRWAIMRLTNSSPLDAVGVYGHWDGYPSGVGCALWHALRDRFNGNAAEAMRFFIDQHPAGWSSICNVDWSLPVGARDHGKELCASCKKEINAHYRQYYREGSEYWPLPDARLCDPTNPVLVLGHAVEYNFSALKGAECYCHGDACEGPQPLALDKASACGVEWVYAFDEAKNKMLILSSYCDPAGDSSGHKMIGVFGQGDPNAVWAEVASIDLADSTEPDWEKIGS